MTLDLGTLVGRADFDTAPAIGRLRDLDQIVARAAGTWEPALQRGGTQAGQAGGQAITDGVRRSGRDSENAVRDSARGWENATRTGGEQAGEAGGRALAQGVESAADRARAAIGDATDSWQAPAQQGGQEAGEAAGEGMSNGITDRIQGIKDKISGILSGDLGGTGMAAAGAAAGGLFITALWGALEQGNLKAKLTAQLGLTGPQSKAAGEAAGKLFAGGYGEGLEDIGEAITAVVRNIDGMRDASSDALADIAGKASTLATVFGEDLTASTRAVSQMIRTGLVKDAGEAFDLLTTGMQNGANAAEDLSDTYIEYGTQFRKMGLDGKDALGLMSQGLQAGARDADLVADAVKEFSIRAIDGSDSTVEAFETIGVSADDMTGKLAAGGTEARSGLQQILEGLRGIEDPAIRSQTAIALFGTQAEDLGDALYTLDLDTAADGLGDVAGATDRANAAFNNQPQAKVSTFFRMVKQEGVEALSGLVDIGNKAANLLGGLGSAVDSAKSGWSALPGPVKESALAIGLVIAANRLLGPQIAGIATRAGAQAAATMAAARANYALARSSGVAAASLSMVKSAGSGLSSILGGPWGVAAVAALSAAAAFDKVGESLTSIGKMDATQAQAQILGLSESGQSLKDALDSTPESMGKVSKAMSYLVLPTRLMNGGFENSKKNVAAYDQALAQMVQSGNGQKAADWLRQQGISAEQAAARLPQYAAALRDAANKTALAGDAAKSAKPPTDAYGRAQQELSVRTTAAKKAQDNLTKAINDTSNAFLGGRASQRDYQAAIDAITDSIKENGRTLDTNTEKGRNNGATLDDLASKTLGLIKGYRDSGMSAEGLAQKMPGLRKQLVDSAIQMGMNAKAAQDYADGALGKIPDQISTTVTADTAAAKAAVTALGYDYDTLPKDVQSKITVRADGTTNAKEALASVGLEARNVPGQTSTVVSVPNAFASAALLSQLKNVAFEVDGKSVTVTSAAPQAAAVTKALQGIRGAQLTADGKSVIIPTGAPTAPMTRLLLENVTGAAYDADSRTVSVPTTAPGAVNATREIDGVTSSAFRVPASRNTTVSATDHASGTLRGIKGNVDAIPSRKTITIDQFFRQYGSMSLTGQARADGGLTLPGGVRAMADGGILGRQAMIARAGTNILWAEDETGGESYIPLAASKRQRSMQILEATAAHFGARVVPMADGGTHATTTVAAGPDLARWERVAERIERAVAQVPPAIATGLDRRDARTAASILTKG
ncbi:phage tail tape measure protein [Yimella sp. cx-573]|nr:phage tail tape measure protein [Yimella sp. cx-573]